MGFVYVVQEKGDGPLKIGWSGSTEGVQRRFKSLRCGNPRELVLRGYQRAPRAYEGHLHWHFADVRLEGEWFEPTDDLKLLARAVEAGRSADTELRAAYDDLAGRILERARQPDGPFPGETPAGGSQTTEGEGER